MCLEIAAKENCKYILNYIPGARCLTDPPLSLTQLIKQRRRWTNGSMFSSFHMLKNLMRVCRRRQDFGEFFRKLFFMVLYLYMIIQVVLSYVLVGTLYGSFSIFVRAMYDESDESSLTKPANQLENIYIITLYFILMLST